MINGLKTVYFVKILENTPKKNGDIQLLVQFKTQKMLAMDCKGCMRRLKLTKHEFKLPS